MPLPAQAESRRRNLGAVLRLVHERGEMRQVEISDALGLTRGTGISLVEELIDLGLAGQRSNEATSRRGRPSPLIGPSPAVVVVTAEIAAAAARVDMVALGGVPIAGVDLPINPSELGPKRTFRRVAAAVSRLLDEAPPLRVVGAAVAIHGAVDDRRRVVFAPNLSWDDTDVGTLDGLLAEALPDRPMPPVDVGNDADLGALGELRRGAGRGRNHFLYLSAERGVGGGIIADGEVLLGANGFAGEVGHLKIGTGGHLCACGQRGCWETEIGGAALDRVDADREPIATWLGRGLGVLVPLLQPGLVILGGHLAEIVSSHRATVDAALVETCPPRLAQEIELVPSDLGKDAALVGAAEVAFERLLSDPAG
jgi:predicted NBD/HSP70 family sugar kinase